MKSHQITLEAIGTKWVLDLVFSDSTQIQQINDELNALTESFDKNYSRFREDSLVAEIAQRSGIFQLTQDGVAMLKLYQKLYSLTDGLFTPLIGTMLADAGYDERYSFESKPLTRPPDFDSVLTLRGSEIHVNQPCLLDFGGIGKGYLIDLIGKLLLSHSIDTFCIDGGGDILYRTNSQDTLRVGLENPDTDTQVIGVATIYNQSICASAGNRRKWGGYHHIMNPKTLNAQNTVKATWVIAETATIADSLATCLFFVPPEKLLHEFQFEYVIIYPDNSVAKSANLPVEFY